MAQLQLPSELIEEYYEQGKRFIWAYKTLYEIRYSHGMGKFYLSYILRKSKSDKLGVTPKGRHIAMDYLDATRF